MRKALIICAAGMSSSMMASKTTEYFENNGHDIKVEAVSTSEGSSLIEDSDFDLFLISPQTKMYFDKFKQSGDRVGKPVTNIPSQAYVPIPMGIEKLAKHILEELPEE